MCNIELLTCIEYIHVTCLLSSLSLPLDWEQNEWISYIQNEVHALCIAFNSTAYTLAFITVFKLEAQLSQIPERGKTSNTSLAVKHAIVICKGTHIFLNVHFVLFFSQGSPKYTEKAHYTTIIHIEIGD